MRKLSLFILLSICLISSSFAKQIICTTVTEYVDPYLMVLHNPAPDGEVLMKKWLLDDRQPYWETTYESESVIVLQSFLEGTGILGTIHITKKSNKLVYTNIWGKYDKEVSVYYGECKFIN
ncbi:hypothetical protein N9746_08085 [Candidatus Thioglobus sp.]|nr:hypothetical protein [Candidatus Thioglobus sp.]